MRVAALNIHPVKGMRAWPVREAVVERWGLAGDRRWVVVDERGKAMTQREHPELATIIARPAAEGLTLSRNGVADLKVPFPTGPAEALRVFSDPAAGSRAGSPASEWLSDALAARVHLLHMGQPRTGRALRALGSRPGEPMSFADEYPVLITSSASLAALNGALGDDWVGMERFRPNIVIDDAEAWAEEEWAEVRIGNARFRAPSSCVRCMVITVDQETGRIAVPGHPLKTLTRLNRGGSGKPMFGRNLIPTGESVIRVGDPIEGLATRTTAPEPPGS